jgi:hypothetical protein
LGMRVPDPSITVGDVAAAVGPDMPVEVIGSSCLCSSRQS